MNTRIHLFIPALCVLLLAACAAPRKADMSELRNSKPASILVLPPVNLSPDIRGSLTVLSTVTLPLAEAGYYVFPVALVDATFKENGLSLLRSINPSASLAKRSVLYSWNCSGVPFRLSLGL